MKSFRSYLTTLDRLKSPIKLSRSLLATTFIAGSHLLAAMPASSNPVPTPTQPSPIVATRTLLNGSFEFPAQSSNGAGFGVLESYRSTPALIWQTTEKGSATRKNYIDKLEIWRGVNTGNGGQSTMSGAGQQYAELNADTNGALYQDICIMPNESVAWSLKHAARNSGQTNKMQVSITKPSAWIGNTPPETKLYTSPILSTSFSQGWQQKTGNWTSTNTMTEHLTFAFQAIEGSMIGGKQDPSYGNFIDDVNLNLSPLIDFLPSNGNNVNVDSTTEGNPSTANPPYYYLSLRINGIMSSAGSVKINLSGLNANRQFKLGSVLKGSAVTTGLTAAKIGNQITLNIPAGTYDANVVSSYIHIPIDFSDTVKRADDNLTFTLFSPIGGGTAGTANLTVGATDCASFARDIVQTLLRDDDYIERVQLPINVATYRSK